MIRENESPIYTRIRANTTVMFALTALSSLLIVLMTSSVLSAQDTSSNHYFNSDGVRLRYTDQGTGEPVILIHGLTSSADDWARNGMLPALVNAGFRAIAIDTRGHGLSEKLYTPKDYGATEVEDLVRLTDHLGLPRVHVVGYSRGADLGLAFLKAHPEKIRSIVLGGYAYDGTSAGLIGKLEQNDQITTALAEGDAEPFIRAMLPPNAPPPSPEAIQQIIQVTFADNDLRAISAAIQGMADVEKPTIDDLESNTIPALAILGENDWMFRKTVEEMSSVTGNFQFTLIADADHLSAFMHPGFTNLVIEFLQDR